MNAVKTTYGDNVIKYAILPYTFNPLNKMRFSVSHTAAKQRTTCHLGVPKSYLPTQRVHRNYYFKVICRMNFLCGLPTVTLSWIVVLGETYHGAVEVIFRGWDSVAVHHILKQSWPWNSSTRNHASVFGTTMQILDNTSGSSAFMWIPVIVFVAMLYAIGWVINAR